MEEKGAAVLVIGNGLRAYLEGRVFVKNQITWNCLLQSCIRTFVIRDHY